MTAKSRRRAIFLAVVAVVACLVHAPLLRSMAGLLIVDEPAGDFQYICISGGSRGPDGDRCYDAAVELHRRKPSARILVVELRPDRLAEIGALPSLAVVSRRELVARGVLPQNVSYVESAGCDGWAIARTLEAFLADRPKTSVALLCGQFHSAHLRGALNASLDPADAARVKVCGLPDRRFDQTNWWTSRDGFKAFGIEWLRRLHGLCVGGDRLQPTICSADDYRRDFRRTLPEASP